VLITGGTGLLGCHAAAALRASGHQVLLLVRNPDKIPRVYRPLGIEAIDHVVGDVTDRESVEAAASGCDAVLHTAALFSFDCRRAEELHFTNVVGSERVLDAAVRRGLDPILHVSSITALFPPDGPLLTPDTSVKQPRDMYARSKADAERIARRLQQDGHPVTILYPGQIWGPCDPTLNDGIQAHFGFARARLFPATPGGVPIVDVRDLTGPIAAALRPGQGPRRYMLGGHFLAYGEVGRIFARLTGRRVARPPVPGTVMRGLGRLVDLVQRHFGVTVGPTYEAMSTLTRGVPCDDSRAREELGFSPRPIEETVRDTLRWGYQQGAISARHVGRIAASEPRPA
jgi:nucleoside-diphosphate-sugar epimerase